MGKDGLPTISTWIVLLILGGILILIGAIVNYSNISSQANIVFTFFIMIIVCTILAIVGSILVIIGAISLKRDEYGRGSLFVKFGAILGFVGLFFLSWPSFINFGQYVMLLGLIIGIFGCLLILIAYLMINR